MGRTGLISLRRRSVASAAAVPVQVDFTDAALASHVTAPGSNSIAQSNLLECSIAGNESYYGFTETVSYTREVYIRQDMKFGANFDFAQGQKILRLRAFNVGGGVNYWDFIAQITSTGNSNPGQAGTNDSYQITIARNSGSTWGTYNKTFVRSQWYTFQYRFYLNSAQGVADGIFQMWLDGVQIFNITNLDLVGAGTWNNTINRILWGGWYSNGAGGNPNAAPDPSPATYQIRNAYRSTAYIEDKNLLLEDFTSLRLNGEGGQLFINYNTEDAGQTSALDAGSLKVIVPSAVGCYMHFLPRGASAYAYPGGYAQSYLKSGTWNANINRLIFLVKTNITVARRTDGGSTMEFGTYARDHDNADTANQGSHYYHITDPNFYADRWMKFVFNRTPQHQVGMAAGTNWGDDPAFAAHGQHYYDELTRFYFDTQRAPAFQSSSWWFDDFLFKLVSGEPDAEISSIACLYTGTQYEASWAGIKGSARTYEIRYKTSSMKTAGFTTGTDGGTATNPGNDYTGCVWQSGAMSENAAGMYIAIRVQSASEFTEVYVPNAMAPGNSGE